MSYIPTIWQTGDIVTATKLNKLEEAVANAGGLPAVTGSDNGDVLTVVEGAWTKAHSPTLIISLEFDSDTDYSTSTKTFKEIQDAISAGYVCYFYVHVQDATQHAEFLYPIVGTNYVNSTYSVVALAFNMSAETSYPIILTTDNENGYPYMVD